MQSFFFSLSRLKNTTNNTKQVKKKDTQENETNKKTHVPDQTLLQHTEMIIKDIPPRWIGIIWLKNGMVSENNSGHGSHG
jgi:uncharacterized protein YycO